VGAPPERGDDWRRLAHAISVTSNKNVSRLKLAIVLSSNFQGGIVGVTVISAVSELVLY
jgi:hypothetical protein